MPAKRRKSPEYAARAATRTFLETKPTAVEATKSYTEELLARAKAIRPPPRGGGAIHRTVVLSDVHFPKQDPAAWSIAVQAVADLKPDSLWLLGDFLDLASVTAHEMSPDDTAAKLTLRKELEAGNAGLDALDRVATHAWDRRFFDGNHEHRLARYAATECPAALLDSLPTISEALYLNERGYDYVGPKRQPLVVGDLHVLHGHWYNLHHAHKHLTMLGVNCIYGHVHTPQQMTTRNQTGNLVATCVPCLRQLDREWVHMRTVHTWTQGFCVIEWDGAQSQPFNVYIKNRRAAYGGHRWMAF